MVFFSNLSIVSLIFFFHIVSCTKENHNYRLMKECNNTQYSPNYNEDKFLHTNYSNFETNMFINDSCTFLNQKGKNINLEEINKVLKKFQSFLSIIDPNICYNGVFFARYILQLPINTEIIKIFIHSGIDLFKKDKLKSCLFEEILKPKYYVILDYFLSLNQNNKEIFSKSCIFMRNITSEKDNCLHYAVITNNLEYAKIILRYNTYLLNMKNIYNQTPLELAFEKKFTKVIKVILENHFQIKDMQYARAIIKDAFTLGDTEIFKKIFNLTDFNCLYNINHVLKLVLKRDNYINSKSGIIKLLLKYIAEIKPIFSEYEDLTTINYHFRIYSKFNIKNIIDCIFKYLHHEKISDNIIVAFNIKYNNTK